ncbi:MAG: Trk system potassium transporter TrkA [Chloroflexota bacterium]
MFNRISFPSIEYERKICRYCRCGIGGYNIASMLSREEHNLVIIDKSEEVIDNVRRYLDVKTICGSGTSPETLHEAEIQNADLLIAATDNDENNIITCFIAKALGVHRTIARVRNPEYTGYLSRLVIPVNGTKHLPTPETLGIDRFVNPDVAAAQEFAGILSGLYTTPVKYFGKGLIEVRDFLVEDSTEPIGSIGKLVFPKPCVIAAIIRDNGVLVPEPEETLKSDDRVLLVASRECMKDIGTVFGRPKPQVRKIVILGAGHIGYRLSQILERQGMHLKIMDSDVDQCRQIAAKLENAEVVQGTGTESDALIEEGIPNADAFVATTRHDELNILSCVLAKSLGVSRTLTLVEKPQYASLSQAVGVNVAVSPVLLMASQIARFVRSPSMVSVSFLAGSKLEAVEFFAAEGASIVGRRVSELNEDRVIGAIVRDEEVIIPTLDAIIESGDRVVMVGSPESIHAAERLFDQ